MLMLVTRRCLQTHQPRPRFAAATYVSRAPQASFLQKRWHRFKVLSVPRKVCALLGLGLKLVGAFVALCCAIHAVQGPFIFRTFLPCADKDYLLEDWADIEPTLKEGDIILMRGRGLMSWTIGTAQYALSHLRHASAFRYSHVAVVVAPAQFSQSQDGAGEPHTTSPCTSQTRWWWRRSPHSASTTAAPSSVREALLAEEAARLAERIPARGALILEAMDNGEYHVPDVDGATRYDAVQLVEARKRLFSQTEKGEPAYYYFSVRRLRPCGLDKVNDAASLVPKGPVAMPVNDIHGLPLVKDSGAAGTSPMPYSVVNESELARRFGESVQQPHDVLREFIRDNVGRPMDASPLYVLSFLSPALYSWLRPERAAQREVSCSELIVELYQRMGVLQRHWRWEPLSSSDAAHATARSANANEATKVLLLQNRLLEEENMKAAAAVVSRARRSDSHIWENTYCRADVHKARRRAWRLPLVKAGELVEGPRELVAGTHEPFLCAPASGVAQSIPLAEVVTADLSAAAGESTNTQTQTRAPQLLHAGLVRRDDAGTLYQLRWFYRHASLQTSPYQFTEAGERRTLDWRSPFALGPEEFVEMPSQRFTFKDKRRDA